MAIPNPQAAADRWTQQLSSAGQRITDGVNAVTKAPGQAAVAQQAKLLQNFTNAVNSGKWAKNTSAVPLSDWQQAMINKGVPRIASGAQQANGKMSAFFTKLFPFQANLQSTVKAMPSLTLQNNIDRMVAWANGMAKFKGS